MKQFLYIIAFFLLCPFSVSAQKNITKSNIIGPNGLEVNSYSGSLFYDRQDFVIPGQGLSLDVTFVFNSSKRNKNRGFGNGWTFAYNMLYSFEGNNILVERSDGREDLFTPDSGGYKSEPGSFDVWEEYQPGQFQLRSKDGTTYFFEDPSHRRLTKIEDRCGNAITLSYTDSLIAAITDATGRTLNLEWTDSLLTKISHTILTEERSYTYEYDEEGNLTMVLDPLGYVVEYQYNDRGRLSAVTDENGTPATIQYNGNGAVKTLNSCNWRQNITYDPDNLKTYVVEQVGNKKLITTIAYDEQGRVMEKDGNCCGYNIAYTYDDNDNITSRQDGNDNRTLYEYDDNGNVIKETDPLGNSTEYTYTANYNNIATEKDKRGFVTSYTYDAKGNVTRADKPLGITESFIYDEFGNMLTHVNGRGDTTSFAYDVHGNMTSIADPEGGVYEMAYDALGNKISETDANDHTYTYEYDAKNRLVKAIDPLDNETMFAYDGRDNMLSKTDANGHTTQYEYDGLDRLITVVTPEGITTSYEYDAQGNAIAITDGNGNTTRYEYNLRGQVTLEVDPLGYSLAYEYDDSGNKISKIDKNGHLTLYRYDALNRLIEMTDPMGGTIIYTYDPNDNLASVTNQNGATITYEYDALNRMAKETDPLGNSIEYAYDDANNRISRTDRNGNEYTYTYDKKNRLTGETDPLMNTSAYIYDPNDNPLSFEDGAGNVTTYTYDELNRLLTETNGAGETTSHTYDPVGNKLTTTYPNNRTVAMTYDEDDRLVSESDGLGLLGSYTYDNNGNRIAETNANNQTFTNAYDALDRLTALTDALGKSVLYEYDGNSNLISLTDRNGNKTIHTYDELNRNTVIQDALGQTTVNAFDPVGNRVSVTDAEGRITAFEYDALDRMTRETLPNGKFRTYTYDAHGNITQKVKFDGTAISYAYDQLNRMTERGYPDNSNTSYTYDAIGRMLSTTNPHASVTFQFDGAHRLVNEALNGQETNYVYDVANNKTTITYPGGRIVEETMDVRNRIVSLSSNSTVLSTYTYDASDYLQSKTYANGLSTTYGYNPNGQVTSIAVNPSQLVGLNYGYDDEGNRLYEEKAHLPSRSEAYTYDPLNRLTMANQGVLANGTITAPDQNKTFAYDGLGNRLSASLNGTSTLYQVNSANQYLSYTNMAGTTALTHDDNGNLTFDGNHTYLYDYDNQLISADNGATAEYQYDGLGRRVKKITGSVEINYFYDDDNQVIEERGAGNAIIATYVYQVGIDELLAVHKNSTTYFYHHNALGSVMAITDNAGNVVEQYDYDTYGTPHFLDPSGNEMAGSTIGNNYLFTGRELDPETGLYHYRARHYNPVLGRFQQMDPSGIREGMNRYQYVGSNPVSWIDPDGLHCVKKPGKKGEWDLLKKWPITKRLGLQKFKIEFESSVTTCRACCEATKSYGLDTKGSFALSVMVEVGTPSWKISGFEIRVGWYADITVGGSLSGGVDQCGKSYSEGCVSLSGELGLIGEIGYNMGEEREEGFGAKGSIKGSIGASGKICMSCSRSGCVLEYSDCIWGRIEVSAEVELPFFGELKYYHEWEIKGCREPIILATLGG